MSPVKDSTLLELIAQKWAAPPAYQWICDREECDGKPHDTYDKHARTNQRCPEGNWRIWYIRAGRGFGKTRTGAETIVEWALAHPKDEEGIPTVWGIFAQTIADIRDDCIRGPGGLLKALERRGIKYTYNQSLQQVTLENGVLIFGKSANDDDVGRGKNMAGAWLDEVVKWHKPYNKWHEGINFALRAKVPNWTPRAVVTTTPKPIDLLKEWQNDKTGYVHMTVGALFDNKDNLDPTTVDSLVNRYEGTRIGRQELYGELLDDVEGALWNFDLISNNRVATAPETLQRLIIAVDPAVTYTSDSDHTGVVVCGSNNTDRQPEYYVLQDASLKAPPEEWARKIILLYEQYKADYIIAEKNQGYDLVTRNIETVARDMGINVNIELVHASRGKALRAEPVSTLYELGRVKHVGDPKNLEALEAQMCSWTPSDKESPDRLDAMVWGITWLAEKNAVGGSIIVNGRVYG